MSAVKSSVALDLGLAFARDGAAFAFFQAMRLMRRHEAEQGRRTTIRVRPNLSLGFPDTDIERIEPLTPGVPGGGWRVTANFFGLYGVASPLPTFYSEDLLDEEREGHHARRDFLDIFHHALYPQLFLAWRKYRLHLRVVEERDPQATGTLYAFAGLGLLTQRAQLPRGAQVLRHLGLFAQQTRSALGLRTLLADAFAPARVRIDSCVLQQLPIPMGQRLRLGMQAHALGEDTHLGMQIEDSENLLRVSLTDLPAPLFQQLLPGAEGHAQLHFLTRFYLKRPLQVDVALSLKAGEREGARLDAGQPWCRLGLDTWLGEGDAPVPTQAAFASHEFDDFADGPPEGAVVLRLPPGLPGHTNNSNDSQGIAHAAG